MGKGAAVSAVMPPIIGKKDPAISEPLVPRQRSPHRPSRSSVLALTGLCAIQATLSLILVWSNTAFGDEADYLRIGHLEIGHWLHGTSWPSAYADQILSGSPAIYPPVGAVADSIGGLEGARILSLVFMLGATILLYLTASRLLGRGGAVAAAAIWALSEPVIRLAFATYDPLSIFLTALSGWLIVQAGYRRRRWAFITAAAAALAFANATAYSGIVIDPIVIAFAFIVWLPRMGALPAILRTVWLAEGCAVFFCILMIASHAWAGIMFTVFNRSGADHQSIRLVLNDTWEYSGLVISLATIGVFTAISAEGPKRATLLTLLGCGALVVPAAQLHEQTGWSLDKHLAYGIWFAAMAAGYACIKLIEWLPGNRWRLTVICCVVALSYPATYSWESAWQVYHSWPEAQSFITAFTPAVAQSSGLIYTEGTDHIAEYYTSQGSDWMRWDTTLSLDPVKMPADTWESYYVSQLRTGAYGVIALFYAASFSSQGLPRSMLLIRHGKNTYHLLLSLVGDNSGEPGLPALTLALENNPNYRLVAVGRYDSALNYSIYAIWQKVQT